MSRLPGNICYTIMAGGCGISWMGALFTFWTQESGVVKNVDYLRLLCSNLVCVDSCIP